MAYWVRVGKGFVNLDVVRAVLPVHRDGGAAPDTWVVCEGDFRHAVSADEARPLLSALEALAPPAPGGPPRALAAQLGHAAHRAREDAEALRLQAIALAQQCCAALEMQAELEERLDLARLECGRLREDNGRLAQACADAAGLALTGSRYLSPEQFRAEAQAVAGRCEKALRDRAHAAAEKEVTRGRDGA